MSTTDEKRRVYEIAKDEGLPSALVLQRLRAAGLDARTASSTVDLADALFVLNPNKYPRVDGGTAPAPARPGRRQAAPAAPAPPAEPEPEPAPAPPPAVEVSGATPSERRKARAAAARAAREAERQAAIAAGEIPPPEEEGVETETAPAGPAPTQEAPAPVSAVPVEEPAATAPAPAEEIPATAPAPAAIPAAVAPTPAEIPAAAIPPEATVAPPPVPPAPDASAAAPAVPEASATPPAPAGRAPAPPQAQPPAARASERPAAPETRRPGAPERRSGPAPSEQARPGAAGRSAPGGPAARPVPGAGPGGASTRPGPGRGRRRRVVIDAQASRRGAPQGAGRRGRGPAKEAREPQPAPARDDGTPVEIRSGAAVKDVAEALGVPSTEIIKMLMTLGEMATITQSLSDEAIELIAAELGRTVRIIRAVDEPEIEEVVADDPADLLPRAPVVTVMGHVDHGKTSLLDAIRATQVAAGEAGGITQHIGAYQVRHGDRELTFLDTPGHEAFTAMRARGAKITDIAVIVVAADDGVMPQTVEAIDHARAASVPFLVAVNKIDKENANPERVRQELAQREVIPREWGGTHEFVDVSAKQGIGLETLLETILLVADVDVDPKANPAASASGTVVESRLDAGRGPVATLLVQRGTLHVGDVVTVGDTFGRVRAMLDFKGDPITGAVPSVPVEALGLGGVPPAGEKFRVVENERLARQMAGERSQRLRAEELANRRPVSLEDLFDRIKEGGLRELNIVLKGDVQGSVGALEDALSKIEQTEVQLNVIRTGVGAITESDVMLASASSAIVLGFNVRPRPEAAALAEREGVDIRTYRVIYRAIEDMRAALVGLLAPEIVEDVVGHLDVRATFRASRIGTIAGCYVLDGTVRRGANVRLVRDGAVVHEGRLASLRRFDDDVREVQAGFECGVLIDGYNDIKDGDQIEVFELREVARTEQAPATAADA